MPELISRISSLGRAGVLLLDNTCNLLAGFVEPARCGRNRAASSTIGGDDGRRRRQRMWCRSTRLLQRFGRKQRHVAGQQDQGAGLSRAAPIPSSAGRALSQVVAPAPQKSALGCRPSAACQRVGLVADDDGRGLGLERGGGGQHVLDHRLAGDAVRAPSARADFMRVPLPAARMTT